MNLLEGDREVMMEKRPLWLNTLIILLVPLVGMAAGVALTLLFDLDQTFSNLTINLFFLAAIIGLISLFKPSRIGLGVQVIKAQMGRHVVISLLVFALYLLFYIVAIRISVLKPFTPAIGWGLLSHLIIVIAEELYFRGLLYGFIQRRFSARAALIVSSVLFGLFHVQQGLRGIITKTFTGWLWGSVRYSSNMIFLLIFPIHFAFNTIWLLFEGNWDNPPAWAIYTLPAAEFLLGFVIVRRQDKRTAIHE
jgi:membrane protease YdiL (CAAX protease family)